MFNRRTTTLLPIALAFATSALIFASPATAAYIAGVTIEDFSSERGGFG